MKDAAHKPLVFGLAVLSLLGFSGTALADGGWLPQAQPNINGDMGGREIESAAGIEATAAGDCGGADSALIDNNGLVGCPKLTDTAPQPLVIRGQPAYPFGTQTAGDLWLVAGADEKIVVIDDSTQCATDTVTVTIDGGSPSILTEGTQWNRGASNAAACASLAAAVDALAGVGATCSTATVGVTFDDTTRTVLIAESDGNCTGANNGTHGFVRLPFQHKLCFDDGASPGECIMVNVDGSLSLLAGGSSKLTVGSTTITLGTLTLAGSGVSMDLSAGNYLRAPVQASASPTAPLACNASNHVGAIAYVDDTDDAAASVYCGCAKTNDSTFDWMLLDGSAPCPEY